MCMCIYIYIYMFISIYVHIFDIHIHILYMAESLWHCLGHFTEEINTRFAQNSILDSLHCYQLAVTNQLPLLLTIFGHVYTLFHIAYYNILCI